MIGLAVTQITYVFRQRMTNSVRNRF